ncbi:MAG: protein-L-isoaspartate O-methyltransferase [Burkholderiales bacterium]|nr:protein-L-isoaspartate O-methyltransferase [Burkholderiales bacterium]
MNLEQARFNMIEQQIRPWNVLDDQVLHLLSVVKREDFVPLAHKALAFVDMEIPIGHGQRMLAPRLEARLLQDAAVQKHEKVLEIGAGSGYLTALLAHQAQRVIALEIQPELAAMARTNLQKAGIHNAEVRQFDGSVGAAAEGPFDVIVLGGCVAEVPQNLLAQLKVGGRLLAIVGQEPVMRATIVSRTGEADFSTRQPWDSAAPTLLNFPVPSPFRF